MTTINNNTNYCTLINVFTVLPEKHEELFQLLIKATEEVICKLPGYVSANLHISDDKETITNYSQWESLEDFKNMMRNEEAQNHMRIVASIATSFKPVTYSQIWSHSYEDNYVQ